jgi:hypothetical protein
MKCFDAVTVRCLVTKKKKKERKKRKELLEAAKNM